MKNKGFTLVEMLVSIGLLVLIGVGVGISLNNYASSQLKNKYDNYIEKIKSTAILYVTKDEEEINKLNTNQAYIIITVEDLQNDGFLEGTVVNPNTGEKIDKNEKIKVSYSSEKELIVEYPYEEKNETFLNASNMSIVYKSTAADNLCYAGLNTPDLALIDGKTGSVLPIALEPGRNIKAYLEDGSECSASKLNSQKVGKYNLKYEYSTDGTNINTSSHVKSSNRVITVNPSVPVISAFTVTNNNPDDIYSARMNATVSDVAGIGMKYCLIYTDADNASDKPNVSKCSGRWKNVTNNNITYDFNIKEDYTDVEGKGKIKFYLYVKNDFEEYVYRESTSGDYVLVGTIVFNNSLEGVTPTLPYTIKNIKYATPYNQVMASHSSYHNPSKRYYAFKGWFTKKNGGGTKYTSSTTTPVIGKLNLYAHWVYDDTPPTCSISVSGQSISGNSTDANLVYKGWNSSYSGSNSTSRGITTGTIRYYAKDGAGNKSSCSLTIVYSNQDCEDKCVSGSTTRICEEHCGYTSPGTYGPTISYDEARWYCPECAGFRFTCWANNTACQCKCGSQYVCDDVCEDKWECNSYTTVCGDRYCPTSYRFVPGNDYYCY